jgi:hypothetical protein
VLLVGSTITDLAVERNPSPLDEGVNAAGCYAIVVGAAAITLGYLMLCVLVFGSRSDPFGVTTLMSLAAVGFGLLVLVPTAIVGTAWRLWRAEWRLAAFTAGVLAVAGALGTVAVGWVVAPLLVSEWLPPTITTLVLIAAASATGRADRTVVVVAILAATLSGGLFGWGIASRLDVRVVNDPSPMRAADAKADLMFEASESGVFEIHAGFGGCLSGRVIAAGRYGPGWEETEDPAAMAQVPLGDTGLVEGSNSLVVCVRHGLARGEAPITLIVDDTSPAAATLDVQPTTGEDVHRTATTRELTFSGTAAGGRAILEMNGLGVHDLDIVDGRWTLFWRLSLVTDQAAFDVVVVDGAGNTSRSNMVHVRIVGIDPPPVEIAGHPGLAIECRGEPRLSPDACRTWAADTLVLHPEFLAEATRFLLALPDQFGACYAESRGADGFTRLGLVIPCPRS